MRICFVLARLPWPLAEGSTIQVTNVIRAAAAEHEVRILALVSSPDEAAQAPDLIAHLGGQVQVETVLRDSRRSMFHRVAYRLLRDLADHAPLSFIPPGEVAFNRSPAVDRRIAALVSSATVDCLATEFWFMSPHILGRGLPAVLDEDDVHFQRVERSAATAPAGFKRRRKLLIAGRIRQWEIHYATQADRVITVSEQDRQTLLGNGVPDHITAVPIGVGPAIRPLPGPAADAPPVVLFVGSFRHAPNADGIAWFARTAWPAVLAQVPAARLIIAGREPPADVLALAADPSIEVRGFVPDLEPLLAAATVVVAPIRFGSGVKVKVLEAMGAARAVVATTVGAEGIDAVPGTHLLVADDPAGLAQATLALLTDPARRQSMGVAAAQLITSTNSPEAIAAATHRAFNFTEASSK